MASSSCTEGSALWSSNEELSCLNMQDSLKVLTRHEKVIIFQPKEL